MIGLDALLARLAKLRREDLMAWIAEELVIPAGRSDPPDFSEEEAARVRLLCVLRYELDIDAEALPVIVSLLDQLHETRRRLRALAGAVTAQDDAVRQAILEWLRAEEAGPDGTDAAG